MHSLKEMNDLKEMKSSRATKNLKSIKIIKKRVTLDLLFILGLLLILGLFLILSFIQTSEDIFASSTKGFFKKEVSKTGFPKASFSTTDFSRTDLSRTNYSKEALLFGSSKQNDAIEVLKQMGGGKYKGETIVKNYTDNPKEEAYQGYLEDREKVERETMQNTVFQPSSQTFSQPIAQTVIQSAKKRKQFKIDMNEQGMKRSQDILAREKQGEGLGDIEELRGVAEKRVKEGRAGKEGNADKKEKKGQLDDLAFGLDCTQSKKECRDIYSTQICRESLILHQKTSRKKLHISCRKWEPDFTENINLYLLASSLGGKFVDSEIRGSDGWWSSGGCDRRTSGNRSFHINNKELLEEFSLISLSYCCHLRIVVNGTQIFIGPYDGWTLRMDERRNLIDTGRVAVSCGLSKQKWDGSIDIRPYLRDGDNNIWWEVCAAGGRGGVNMVFRVHQRWCEEWDEKWVEE